MLLPPAVNFEYSYQDRTEVHSQCIILWSFCCRSMQHELAICTSRIIGKRDQNVGLETVNRKHLIMVMMSIYAWILVSFYSTSYSCVRFVSDL